MRFQCVDWVICSDVTAKHVTILCAYLRIGHMKEILYEVQCLKSNEDMSLALAGQFKQLSHEPEKFR